MLPTTTILRMLEGLRASFGMDAAARKRELLGQLGHRQFPTRRALVRYHELLCWWRAYPENAGLLADIVARLDAFDRRADLKRCRRNLIGSGIKGTDITFPFFYFTAGWLARRWPDSISIDWSAEVDLARLERLLPLLLPATESLTVDQLSFTAREWLEELKGSSETDATFLVRRFQTLPFDDFGREIAYDDMGFWLRLKAGPTTPNRSRAFDPAAPIVFRTGPIDTSRSDLAREARRPPLDIRSVPQEEAVGLIDMARTAMVTRDRDLDVFENANPNDVLRIDCGGGLQFIAIGPVAERRMLLEAVYGLITLRNGVPIGYVLISSLFGTTEIAYNVFETFRGGESGHLFGRVIATALALFGSDTFSIEPYQLGYGNAEGLKSGAWWFYYKIGFRPVEPGVLKLAESEAARVRADPRHRTDRRTLKKLASERMFRYLGRPRADVLGRIPLDIIGLALTRRLAARGGADREGSIRDMAREAARRLGFGGYPRLNAAETMAWNRWGPIIDSMAGVERWTIAEKRAAVAVLRAKGGRHEYQFVRLFDGHPRLR
ncbi:MAG: hypothetical protein SGI90_11080, partial [Candidatus Eisenbacteria bacterium]|nr:hypothetical protein [Candidatus Eisenbacteria bacterium]